MKSSSHSGRSSLLFPAASARQFPAASSLLRQIAGLNEVDESCGNDVEEELLLELDDSWSDVAFDHWLTHKCNRALRSAHRMTGRQECLRATAQPRRDEDRAHIRVLPRSSALPHWPLPPLWGSWVFGEVPVHLSLDPLCSAHALTLWSGLHILAFLDFFEEGAGTTEASAGE